MVLLRTNTKVKTLSVGLYPLFKATHMLILRQQRQTFPRVLVIILTVLFYKHWLKMFGGKCSQQHRKEHFEKAEESLKQFDFFPPEAGDMKFSRFIAIDDKVKQTLRYRKRIL